MKFFRHDCARINASFLSPKYMKTTPSLAGLTLAASLFLTTTLPTAHAQKVAGDKVNMTPSISGGAPIKLTIYNFNPTPATGFWVTPAGVLASLPGAPTIPPTGTTPITINTFRYATVFFQRPQGGGRWGHLDGPNPNPVMILGTPPPGFKVNRKNLAGGGGEVPEDNGPDGKKKKVVNVKNVTNTTTTVTPPAAPAPVAPAPTAPKAAAERSPFQDGGYYYLSAQFPGEEKILSVVKAGPVAKAELAAKREKKVSANQWWKVTPLGDGYYRLTTKALGDGYSLDVIGDDPENDQIQLVKTGAYSGQMWKITEATDGYFRLTTQFKGPSMALDVCNEGDKTRMVGLVPSKNSSGQFWMFRKASGGKK